ncbi:MAG: CPBP family intramembrane metalloprotease [Bacteroidetes bacterium]|nr:CPBP family intramembrane metalloprotease [Bacteroidota bacterium]
MLGLIIAIPIFGSEVLTSISDLSGESMLNNLDLQRYFQIVSQIGTFILPAALYAFFISRQAPSYLRLDKRPRLISLVLAFLSILVSLPFISWLLQLNASFHLPDFLSGLENWMRSSEEQAARLTEAFLGDTSAKGLIINIVMIGILASVGEELLFRGILIRLFREWLKNPHLAVVISAILFSAMHLQFYGFLPRMVLGILLGYLFVWTRNLWVPILTHLVNNTLSVVAAYMYNAGTISQDMDSFGSSANPLVISISFIFILVVLFALYRYEISKSLIAKSGSD